MEERILQLLEGLNAKVDTIEAEVGSLRTEMQSRFDRVDDVLEKTGDRRIADGQAISKKELTSIKVRIFDLESKTR